MLRRMFLILLLKTNPCNFSRRVFMPNEGAHFETVNGNAQVIQVGGNMIGDNVAGNKTITQQITNLILGDKTQIALRNRQIMIEQMRRCWIEGVLENSIHHAVLLKIGKQMEPGAVDFPWEMQFHEMAEQETQCLSKTKPIIEIFEEQGRALLILGAPGSGKTITLLELTREALDRAEVDPTWPIPIVLNLSSWAERQPKLEEWIIQEMNLKYNIRKKIGTHWLEHNALLLLLDGLDEVKEECRTKCIETINAFRQTYGINEIVVCSRLEEYQHLNTQLKLNAALVLQPLTLAQVDEYLLRCGDKLAALRAALPDDPALQELATSPLMLSMMTLAYRNMPKTVGIPAETLADKRQQVLAVYVERMLQQHYSDRVLKWRRGEDLYTPQQTKHWLSWLAAQMHRHSQSEFFIEGLQPTWLATRMQRLSYDFGARFISGVMVILAMILPALTSSTATILGKLIGGERDALNILEEPLFGLPDFTLFSVVSYGLILGLSFELASILRIKLPTLLTVVITISTIALFNSWAFRLDTGWNWEGGIITGIFFGLIGGFGGVSMASRKHIEIADILTWSWRKAQPGVIGGSAFMGLIAYSADKADKLNVVLETGIPTMIVLILLTGLNQVEVIEMRSIPNQGIRQSAQNAFRVGGMLTLIIVLIILIIIAISRVNDPQGNWMEVMASGLTLGLLIGTLEGLHVGGAAYIQHQVLAWLLTLYGNTPKRFVKFLEYAADRLFLRRIGGGYIFVHRMLLEYFVQLENRDV